MPEFKNEEEYEKWKAEKIQAKTVEKQEETKQKTITNLKANVQYCPQCGKENIDKAKFCIKCGSELLRDKNISTTSYSQSFSSKDSKHKHNYLWFLLIAIVVILSVVVVFFKYGYKTKKDVINLPTESEQKYIAMVGNEKITRDTFYWEFKNLPEFARESFKGKDGKEKFLDELIKKEILYQEAMKKGLDKYPEYLKKVENFKKLTLVENLLEKEIDGKSKKVTEKDVVDYYDKHKEEFCSVSQLKAGHILVQTEDEAKKIYENLNKGANFDELAKKYSIDIGSAKNGGNLGFFSTGQMDPDFEAAATKLRIGEISQPVKTKYGYHIIKLTDKKLGKPIEFDKVKGLISQRLGAEKQKDLFDRFMETVKKSYRVDKDKKELAELTSEEDKEKGKQ
jgi:parvulin-like peptidyl-prolyl isomerase/ribosomal protein L40E